jgi:hypothetical protein
LSGTVALTVALRFACWFEPSATEVVDERKADPGLRGFDQRMDQGCASLRAATQVLPPAVTGQPHSLRAVAVGPRAATAEGAARRSDVTTAGDEASVPFAHDPSVLLDVHLDLEIGAIAWRAPMRRVGRRGLRSWQGPRRGG